MARLAEVTRKQREGFLVWLINSAGVLVDRSDGAISFAHLSFQEFLAAHYLFATREGDARVAAVLAHAGDLDWWETLRLWAGLTGDLSPEKLAPVLTALCREPHSFWLAGSILADGTGQPADFEAWRNAICGRLARHAWSAGHQCARAWATSKQHDRRTRLAAAVAVSASSAHWLDGIALADWSDAASVEVAPSPHLVAMLDPIASEVALARSRALAGSSWRWPGHDLVTLLRLWPSGRARASLTLQTLASLGPDRPTVLRVAPLLVERARRAAFDPEIDVDLVRDFGRDLGRDFVRDLGRDFRDGAVGGLRADRGGLGVRPGLGSCRGRPRHAPQRSRARVGPVSDGVPGLAGPRAGLAPAERCGDALSGRLALAGAGPPHRTDVHGGGSGRARGSGRAAGAARRPLAWALRHYVRGDIVMRDGTVITMNEICDELGVPQLPLLEDMTPEIEIDFGEADGGLS